MKYAERVEHNLRGLTAVSIGVCPGCDECRNADGDYRPDEDWDTDQWTFKARPGATYASEEAAIEAAKVAFDEDWRACKLHDQCNEFSARTCGICGSYLAGSRDVWHAIDAGGELRHYDDACSDCALYIANGDEPEGDEPEGGAA